MIKKILIVFAILIIATVFIGGAYLMGEFEPKRPKSMQKTERNTDTDQEARDIIAKSVAFENEYKARVGINNPKEDDIKILEKALAALEEYVFVAQVPDRLELVRIVEFKRIIESFYSKEKNKEILETIEKAENCVAKEDFEQAQVFFALAIKLQADLNAEYPKSIYANNVRAGVLGREMNLLKARPLYNETVKAEEAAIKAVAKKDWKEASAKYKEAIYIQDKINRLHPDLSFASVYRSRFLQKEYSSIVSAPEIEKIDSYISIAAKAMEEKAYIKAAEAFQDAVLAQQSLNKNHPNSKFVSLSNLQKWTIEKEKALTTKEALDISSRIKNINETLKGEKPEDVVPLLSDLLASAENFRLSAPNNLLVNDNDVLKLKYLNYVKNDIAKIQKELKQSLHSDIFNDKWLLMKSEVWQDLYKLIMQDNPSKNMASGKNPVENVTREEVEDFILRLSWILSREVDLPTREIFTKAIGSMKYINLRDIAWYDNTSDKATKEIMTSRPNNIGFYDLLGNVAEYIEGNAIMGGSAESNSDSLLHLGEDEDYKTQRSPYVGFRVMIAK